jgi:thiamine-phosphate pyrophosphorylase
MLLCYITDRKQFPGNEAEQSRRLLEKIAEAAAAGVDTIQLRERDLSGRELEKLAHEAVAAVRFAGTATRLLINSRVDIALACQADGVHLRSDDILASDARAIAGARENFIVGVSCHTPDEVQAARTHGADFAVFAPVFEKEGRPGSGLAALREACAVVPKFVIALGGVTAGNAASCVQAGAAGVAGIRLFQHSDVAGLVKSLRSPETVIPKIK